MTSPPVPLPRFSVVVPTYNRPEAVRNCLQALSRLRYPKDRLEVIVVDDGGRSPLDGIVEGARASLDVQLLRKTNAGPGAARNAGSRRATGQYLAFTDDDCEPDPGWLEALARRLSSEPYAMVGGRTVNALVDNLYSEASQTIVDFVYRYYNRDSEDARFFASNNMAVPATRFSELGGFDTSFRVAGEDRELCRRWREAGNRLTFEPRAVVLHSHALTPTTFARQHFAYGRGAFRFHRAAGQGAPGVLGEMGFYRDLPRLVAQRVRHESSRRSLWLVVLLGVWQLANVTGYVRERVAALPGSRT